MSTDKPIPDIRPGELVIVKHGNNRMLARALRLYTKREHQGGFWQVDVEVHNVPYVEVLELVNITNLSSARSYDNGNFTQHYRLVDVKPYDQKEEEELFTDLATRLRRVKEQVRLYQATTECDPSFAVQKWTVQGFAEERRREEKKPLNTSELLIALYGECYANAHQKGKLV